MINRKLFFKLLIAWGLSTTCFYASDLGTTTQKVQLPPAPGQVSEKWRHGHLISAELSKGDVTIFTVTDKLNSSNVVYPFSPPNSTRVWIHDFDFGRNGTLVFSGQSYSPTGQLAPFIGIKNPEDQEASVIKTFPYNPSAIAVAPDGTIWTVGLESINGDVHAQGVDPNGHVIRHFDRSGVLIASELPLPKLVRKERSASGLIAATSSRIGWYSPINGKAVYVELSPDLSSHQVYPGAPTSSGMGQVLGFVLTESGEAYLNWEVFKGPILTYKLDRSLKRWVEITVPRIDAKLRPILKGDDDGLLVFRSGYTVHFLQKNVN